MDISEISKYYELKPRDVKPVQLLLDPSNPRIVLDVNTDKKFSFSELQRPEVQDYILTVINKQAHHIADLIRGIETSGFIDKGDDMIVRQVPNSPLYLVIEGNRRTTAIKHLLRQPERLKPVVRETLAVLHVKEFIYRPNPQFTEEMIIDTLLGTIHITGRLEWGALERAYYVYKSYLRELRRHSRNAPFAYLPICSKQIATFFNLSVKAVRKELIVYRVYEQLREHKYEVKPHHFSLIEMAVTDRKLSEQYFELDAETFCFSNRGLSRFDRLCIRDKKPINNPKEFRAFAAIYKYGTDNEVALAESGEDGISRIWDRVSERLDQRGFINDLERIKVQLESLRPAEFRGLKSEVELVHRIRGLVDEILLPLTKKGRYEQ